MNESLPWSDSRRNAHRQGCVGQHRLNLTQKLEIVARATAALESPHYRTKTQLAGMFGKSQSAISKILRPENVAKLKSAERLGFDRGSRRLMLSASKSSQGSEPPGWTGTASDFHQSTPRSLSIIEYLTSTGHLPNTGYRFLNVKCLFSTPAAAGSLAQRSLISAISLYIQLLFDTMENVHMMILRLCIDCKPDVYVLSPDHTMTDSIDHLSGRAFSNPSHDKTRVTYIHLIGRRRHGAAASSNRYSAFNRSPWALIAEARWRALQPHPEQDPAHVSRRPRGSSAHGPQWVPSPVSSHG